MQPSIVCINCRSVWKVSFSCPASPAWPCYLAKRKYLAPLDNLSSGMMFYSRLHVLSSTICSQRLQRRSILRLCGCETKLLFCQDDFALPRCFANTSSTSLRWVHPKHSKTNAAGQYSRQFASSHRRSNGHASAGKCSAIHGQQRRRHIYLHRSQRRLGRTDDHGNWIRSVAEIYCIGNP